MKKTLLYIFVLLALTACKKKNSDSWADAATSVEAADAYSGYLSDIVDKDVEILATAYIVEGNAPNGSDYVLKMPTPDDYPETIGSYNLGQKVSIVRYVDDWVGVLDSTHYDASGTWQDEMIYKRVYIKKNVLGSPSRFLLEKQDFRLLLSGDATTKSPSADMLQFEVISKETYEEHKRYVRHFFLEDTLSITKWAGVLKLPCEEKTVELSDVESEGDNMVFYTYAGQVEALNVYVVASSVYEWFNYKFYDKTSGEEIASFHDNFIISPDKKYIVDVFNDPYSEDGVHFNLYNVTEVNKITQIAMYHFPKWVPFYRYQDKNNDIYFFDNHNSLYIKTLPSSIYYNISDEDKEIYAQYIRIKIMV